MYAVGVGKAVEDELREIASEPADKHFYYTADFAAISTIAENLKLNVCPGASQLGQSCRFLLSRTHHQLLLHAPHIGHAHLHDLVVTFAPTGR